MSAKIAAALLEVMQAVSYVQRTGRNDFHKYNYAGEGDLLDKLRPAMLKAGLMLLPSVDSVSPIDEHGNVSVLVSYTLIHKDGDVWDKPLVSAGCGNDKAKNGTVGDKGVYKAITGANKYLLFKLFQIATGDEPEQASAHEEHVDRVPDDRKESLSTVLERAYRSIDMAETPDALKATWDGLKPVLVPYGIVNGHGEYTSLHGAVTTHLAKLKAPRVVAA